MTPLKPQITYDDFTRLDLRIGRIVDVQPFPHAKNPSWKVGVDVGAERIMWASVATLTFLRCPREFFQGTSESKPHQDHIIAVSLWF